jgi:hypothetical protein
LTSWVLSLFCLFSPAAYLPHNTWLLKSPFKNHSQHTWLCPCIFLISMSLAISINCVVYIIHWWCCNQNGPFLSSGLIS